MKAKPGEPTSPPPVGAAYHAVDRPLAGQRRPVIASVEDAGCPMCKPMAKFELPESRKRLVELMQELNFGRIQNLHVAGGDPVLLDPPPSVFVDYRLGADNSPRPERDRERFVLKSQVVELFEIFDNFGDGVVELIDVKHGLPFRVVMPKPMG